jgi:acetyl-CoA carboxylase biotin carboxyl carrier protein
VEDEARLGAALEHDVRAVLQAIAGSAVEEICFERGGVRVMLRRAFEAAAEGPVAVGQAPLVGDQFTAANATADPGTIEVRSEHVGIFHRSREPGGKTLAEDGITVSAGQPIGVVETLGMSADVEAPAAGTLAELLVEDGEAVEFGQALAVIAAQP